MRWFALVFFISMIISILFLSFHFAGNESVKDSTKAFIHEIIENQASVLVTETDNEDIALFFQSFQDLKLPNPINEGIEIPYFDEFTHPIYNDKFAQYISVKYEEVVDGIYDTDIYFEFISFKEDGNMDEIYFGQLTLRTAEDDPTKFKLLSMIPMKKQK